MSKRAADILRDDLEASPPARLSEVELAQKDILGLVRNSRDRHNSIGNDRDDKFI